MKKAASLFRITSKIRVRSWPDQLVVGRDLVADGAERASAGHLEPLLPLHMGPEPLLQVTPGVDRGIGGVGAAPDGLEPGLEHLVNQPFLAPEIVVELALSGARGGDDLVRARGGDALLVEKVGGGADDPEPGFRALGSMGGHRASDYGPSGTMRLRELLISWLLLP
jgi:hypothetical protein